VPAPSLMSSQGGVRCPPAKATYWSFPYFLREKPYKI